MDCIMGINEFGNLIPVEIELIQKVKKTGDTYEVIMKSGQLHYLTQINYPERLSHLRERKKFFTAIAQVGNRKERVLTKPGYVRVYHKTNS